MEQDYALTPMTEVAYLFANGVRLARLAYEPPGDVPSINGENLHVFFELGDHLGSTSVVLDKATGELVERSTYQAYGGTESDYRPERWKSFREDYRFTGKEEDVEVGLIYFGYRFLNPLLNRWVSADPLTVHGLGADPNLYAYVSGRVLQSVDPLGLDGCSDSGQGGCGSQDSQEGTPSNGTQGTGNVTSETGGGPHGNSILGSSFNSFHPYIDSATAERDTPTAAPGAKGYSMPRPASVTPTLPRLELPSVGDSVTCDACTNYKEGGGVVGYLSYGIARATAVPIDITFRTVELGANIPSNGELAGQYSTKAVADVQAGYPEDVAEDMLRAVKAFTDGFAGLLGAVVALKPAPNLEKIAKAEANAAQSAKPRPGAAGAMQFGDRVITGRSSGGSVAPLHHPDVQRVLDAIPESLRGRAHGRCVEPQCISTALELGIDTRGGVQAVYRVKAPGNANHLTPLDPCPTCTALGEHFGISNLEGRF